MTCVHCGSDVPEERAEFLQERGSVLTCTGCSGERPQVCFMDFSHKTAPVLVIAGSSGESVRRAERVFRRAR